MRYLVLFLCYIKSERTDLKPEIPSQIHLSYHDAQTRSISWVTFENSPVSIALLSSGFALNIKIKQYLFLKERNVGRLKRSLVYRHNQKVFEGICYFKPAYVNFISASTEIFVEPEMNLAEENFFSLEPPIAPKVRYIHNVTFPVTIGGYSYMVGNQDAVSEQLEFDVFDDRNIHVLAVGDLGKFHFWALWSKNLI